MMKGEIFQQFILASGMRIVMSISHDENANSDSWRAGVFFVSSDSLPGADVPVCV